MNDRCPFCGAGKLKEPQYAMDYECGHIDKPGFRHEVCAMRQIANLTAELAGCRERLEAWREYGKYLSMMVPNVYRADLDGHEKLKSLGGNMTPFDFRFVFLGLSVGSIAFYIFTKQYIDIAIAIWAALIFIGLSIKS